MELMEISFSVVEEEVHKEIIKEGLTDAEAHCIYVTLSYNDGNPPRTFYDQLARESWFTIEGVTAENYLASDLYDFYLSIRIHDYRLEQLTKEEQENVVNSLDNIEKRLLEKYGFYHVGTWDFDSASRMITRIAANNWFLPRSIDAASYQP